MKRIPYKDFDLIFHKILFLLKYTKSLNHHLCEKKEVGFQRRKEIIRIQENFLKICNMLKILQMTIKRNAESDLKSFSNVKNFAKHTENLQIRIDKTDESNCETVVIWFYLITRLSFKQLTTRSFDKFSDLAFFFQVKEYDQQFNEFCKLIDSDGETLMNSKELFYFRTNILMLCKRCRLLRLTRQQVEFLYSKYISHIFLTKQL